ncbi:short chain dehydrogenase domain-containing protein [Hirsutella rhossiliensis]|uniref:Short chain dehydrogenase domain-containing protein n=1 Tax=Hirsutella rhossiliensis TaxID=111463 RepID=A0A9P8SEA6_9HYPO|nr:short chain dehydrogenase domain-containing protein [Hirsutella rhossiliensis]KAH0959476.1 short chain dehydrogenase domain-containing protein [Hirsutella rhossiliensis]
MSGWSTSSKQTRLQSWHATRKSSSSGTPTPNVNGYVAIVTGGNSGIGYKTALQLAKRGARVYIASRSRDRVDQAIAAMKTGADTLDVQFLSLDLQDL